MNGLKRALVLAISAVMLVVNASCSSVQTVGNMQDTAENTAAVTETAAGTTAEAAAATGTTDAEGTSIGKDTLNTEKSMLYPAQENYLDGSKWGYIDDTGRFAVEPQFSQAGGFQDNGLAIVCKDNKYGIIDGTGKLIAEPVYDYINDYSEGFAIASDAGGSVVLDGTGKEISNKYGFIGSYKNKRAIYLTKTKDGAYIYGYLDESGKPAIEAAYQSATEFNDGKATVMYSEQQFALIDISGKVIKTFNYTYVGKVSEGMMEFRSSDNEKYGYMDTAGNIVIKPAFSYAYSFEGGKAVVSKQDASGNSLYGLIDKTGKFVIEPKYSDVRQLGENRFAVGRAVDPNFPPAGTRYALADQEGRLLTDFIYYDILQHFEDGTASVNDGKELYFIDTAGKRVDTLPSAEGSGALEKTGDLICANVDQRLYYMNGKGEVVYKPASLIELGGGLTVSENKFKPNRDYLVYYPVLSGMTDTKAQESLNKLLGSETGDTSAASIKVEDSLDYQYDSNFSVGLRQKDLLVILKTGYFYPKGAAHGMPSKECLHIDLKSGAVYQLKDLFKSGSNYTKVLSDIVGKQMKDKMASDPDNNLYWTEDYKGIGKNQLFYVTGHSLVLYFTPYEIAPYAAGFPEFSVKFDEIKNILDKEGAFWNSFN